jgi:antitoxin HicB
MLLSVPRLRSLRWNGTVTMPALPGLVTEGDTLEEARAMVKDAIRGYLETLLKNGEQIPLEPSPATVELVEVKI